MQVECDMVCHTARYNNQTWLNQQYNINLQIICNTAEHPILQ